MQVFARRGSLLEQAVGRVQVLPNRLHTSLLSAVATFTALLAQLPFLGVVHSVVIHSVGGRLAWDWLAGLTWLPAFLGLAGWNRSTWQILDLSLNWQILLGRRALALGVVVVVVRVPGGATAFVRTVVVALVTEGTYVASTVATHVAATASEVVIATRRPTPFIVIVLVMRAVYVATALGEASTPHATASTEAVEATVISGEFDGYVGAIDGDIVSLVNGLLRGVGLVEHDERESVVSESGWPYPLLLPELYMGMSHR